MDTNILAILLALIGFIFYGWQRYNDQKRYNALIAQILAKAKEEAKASEEDGEEKPDNQTTKALYHLIGTLQGQNLSKDQLITDLLREKREMIVKLEGKDKQISSLRVDMANCQEMIAKIGKFDDSTLP